MRIFEDTLELIYHAMLPRLAKVLSYDKSLNVVQDDNRRVPGYKRTFWH